MTYAEFRAKYKITFTIQPINLRPDGLMNDSPMFHYKVRVGCGRRSFGLYFSTGTGWKTVPTADDVLDCLASDASTLENTSGFEDWAREFGFDVDSRKAEKVYRANKRQSEQLKRTIGGDAYRELLWETERQ